MDLQWRKEWTAPSAVGAVTFAAGVGVGYGIRSYLNYRLIKNLREHLQEIEDSVNDIKENADQLVFNDIVEPINEDGIYLYDSLVNNGETSGDLQEEDQVLVELERSSAFPEVEDDWDYAEETAGRNPNEPYIIHRDEYDDNENDFTQTTLTYYSGDQILCDEGDVPIYNPDQVAGELKFGHGSRDPNVVYVRNEKLGAEYEILLDKGFYTVEVLGQEYEDSFDKKKAPLQKFKEE